MKIIVYSIMIKLGILEIFLFIVGWVFLEWKFVYVINIERSVLGYVIW